MNQFLGHHVTLDLYDCDTVSINDTAFVKATLLEVTNLLKLTVVNATIHAFSPIGVSGVVIIEESHIAIHTWPEHAYVAIDFFTYEKTLELDKGISFIVDKFQATHYTKKSINRGDLTQINTLKKV